MKYNLTDGTQELYNKAKEAMSLFMTVRGDELATEYDLDLIEAQDQARREMAQLAKVIFLHMED